MVESFKEEKEKITQERKGERDRWTVQVYVCACIVCVCAYTRARSYSHTDAGMGEAGLEMVPRVSRGARRWPLTSHS